MTKREGERMGKKADGCFQCGAPSLSPLSLHVGLVCVPRPCLIVLIILSVGLQHTWTFQLVELYFSLFLSHFIIRNKVGC